MTRELIAGTRLGEFEVVQTLGFSQKGGVYTVRDRDGGMWVAKERIPPAGLGPLEMERRTALLGQAWDILSAVQEPGMARLRSWFSWEGSVYMVMERVDGIPLRKLIEMSLNPLPEKQVLEWGVRLARTLSALHDRPHPYLFDALDASHIMITPGETLKLINFGLGRFLEPEAPDVFAPSRGKVADDVQRFGETLLFLLTRRPVTLDEFLPTDPVSEPTRDLVLRCLRAHDAKISLDFTGLALELQRILHPPPPVRKTLLEPVTRLVDWQALRRSWEDRFLALPVWKVGAVAAVLLAVVGLGWAWLNHGPAERNGPAVYAATGRRVWMIPQGAPGSRTYFEATQDVRDLAVSPDGSLLAVALTTIPRVELRDGRTQEVKYTIQVDKLPRRVLFDGRGHRLFVLSSGLLSVVDLETSPPKVVAMAPTGLDGGHLVQSGTSTLVSSGQAGRVANLQVSPMRLEGEMPVEKAGALAVSPDGSMVAVGSGMEIALLDAKTWQPLRQLHHLGGQNPVELFFSRDGANVWTVNASGQVAVLSVAEDRVLSRVSLGTTPCAAVRSRNGDELFVALPGRQEVAVVRPARGMVTSRIPLDSPVSAVAFAP